MDVKHKIGVSFIYLIALLNMVPSLFDEPYNINVYYTLLFVLKFYLSSVIPFLFCQIPLMYKVISGFLAGWMLAGVAVHIMNFQFPWENFNSFEDSELYTKIILALITAVLLTMFYESIRKKDERFS